jgi:hypothetical protein
MATLAATSSATPSLQSTLIRSRIDAARREADRAEANANNLRLQADEQERVVQQARGQVQTLQKRANSNSPSSPAPSFAVDATQEEPTYAGTLAKVFQAAKPILESDMSTTQKNAVTTSLIQATNASWSATQNSSQAIQRYDRQAVDVPSKTVGRMIDSTA